MSTIGEMLAAYLGRALRFKVERLTATYRARFHFVFRGEPKTVCRGLSIHSPSHCTFVRTSLRHNRISSELRRRSLALMLTVIRQDTSVGLGVGRSGTEASTGSAYDNTSRRPEVVRDKVCNGRFVVCLISELPGCRLCNKIRCSKYSDKAKKWKGMTLTRRAIIVPSNANGRVHGLGRVYESVISTRLAPKIVPE